jgi:hypothetical protein
MGQHEPYIAPSPPKQPSASHKRQRPGDPCGFAARSGQHHAAEALPPHGRRLRGRLDARRSGRLRSLKPPARAPPRPLEPWRDRRTSGVAGATSKPLGPRPDHGRDLRLRSGRSGRGSGCLVFRRSWFESARSRSANGGRRWHLNVGHPHLPSRPSIPHRPRRAMRLRPRPASGRPGIAAVSAPSRHRVPVAHPASTAQPPAADVTEVGGRPDARPSARRSMGRPARRPRAPRAGAEAPRLCLKDG